MIRYRLLITLVTSLVSLVLAILVLLPIPDFLNFKLLTGNLILVSVFFFTSIVLFSYRHQVVAFGNMILKSMIPIIIVPIVFILISYIFDGQEIMDNEGLDSLVSHLSSDYTTPEKNKIAKYIRNEYIFFGVGSVISIIVLAFRTILSIWRNRNRGTA